MDLDTYLSKRGWGAAASLAKRIGVSPVMVSLWRTGAREVPAEHCPAIEKLTGGDVRCETLRPDIDWGYLRVEGDFSKVSEHGQEET